MYRPDITKDVDVDENMTPYFGGYGGMLKQAMRQKPVRFWYKTWCLNFANGYLLPFEFYQGASGPASHYANDFGVGKVPFTFLAQFCLVIQF